MQANNDGRNRRYQQPLTKGYKVVSAWQQEANGQMPSAPRFEAQIPRQTRDFKPSARVVVVDEVWSSAGSGAYVRGVIGGPGRSRGEPFSAGVSYLASSSLAMERLARPSRLLSDVA